MYIHVPVELETEFEVAEKSSWDQAKIWQKTWFGLEKWKEN
jgi:hypothetical protein